MGGDVPHEGRQAEAAPRLIGAPVAAGWFVRTSRHAPLGAKERAALPNSAFAYIDSGGRRVLPIHDEAHVRNALTRFSRVHFEDDAARDLARMRLLEAAKKHGIMPLGFVSRQLAPDQKLPRGHVTFLLADIEGSTGHLHRLGEGYGGALVQLRRLLRASSGPPAAGRSMRAATSTSVPSSWRMRPSSQRSPSNARCTTTPGRTVSSCGSESDCTGRASLNETGYIGLAVHTVARVCLGPRRPDRDHVGDPCALGGALPAGVQLVSLGTWRLNGLRESTELLQVQAGDLLADFPPLRSAEPVAR